MKKKIITDHIRPPVPWRRFDWQAWRDGDDDTGPWGFGCTEDEAIKDLTEQEEDYQL